MVVSASSVLVGVRVAEARRLVTPSVSTTIWERRPGASSGRPRFRPGFSRAEWDSHRCFFGLTRISTGVSSG
jgi:hypothetical protein